MRHAFSWLDQEPCEHLNLLLAWVLQIQYSIGHDYTVILMILKLFIYLDSIKKGEEITELNHYEFQSTVFRFSPPELVQSAKERVP